MAATSARFISCHPCGSLGPHHALPRAGQSNRQDSEGTMPEKLEPQANNAELASHDRLVYLPAASHCYAIVQYDPASARLVRRVVGLFRDVGCAETYARDGGYHLYDIVPATAVIPKTL